jgi:hypothetical protein
VAVRESDAAESDVRWVRHVHVAERLADRNASDQLAA